MSMHRGLECVLRPQGGPSPTSTTVQFQLPINIVIDWNRYHSYKFLLLLFLPSNMGHRNLNPGTTVALLLPFLLDQQSVIAKWKWFVYSSAQLLVISQSPKADHQTCEISISEPSHRTYRRISCVVQRRKKLISSMHYELFIHFTGCCRC